jgi:putative endonuclease
MGEIDLVMTQGEELVFVEVRYRKRDGYGGGLESVDTRKRQRLIRAADHFLQRHHAAGGGKPCRFDVVAISGPRGGEAIQWVRGAFDA